MLSDDETLNISAADPAAAGAALRAAGVRQAAPPGAAGPSHRQVVGTSPPVCHSPQLTFQSP